MRKFTNNGWQNLTDVGFNDIASSFYNNTNRFVTLSEHINGGGKSTAGTPEYQIPSGLDCP